MSRALGTGSLAPLTSASSAPTSLVLVTEPISAERQRIAAVIVFPAVTLRGWAEPGDGFAPSNVIVASASMPTGILSTNSKSHNSGSTLRLMERIQSAQPAHSIAALRVA